MTLGKRWSHSSWGIKHGKNKRLMKGNGQEHTDINPNYRWTFNQWNIQPEAVGGLWTSVFNIYEQVNNEEEEKIITANGNTKMKRKEITTIN